MKITLPTYSYRGGYEINGFFRRAVEQARALPNVQAAAVVNHLPLGRGVAYGSFTLKEGLPSPSTANPESWTGWTQRPRYYVSPGYFLAMATPLLKGRDFTDQDNREGAPPVVIINETFAREFFTNTEPLGRRLRLHLLPGIDAWATIVGVTRDMKAGGLGDDRLWLSKPTLGTIFIPHAFKLFPEWAYPPPWSVGRDMHLVVRAKSNPLGMVAAVRRQLRALDPDQPVTDIKTMEQKVMDSVASRRIGMLQMVIFAAVALLLAAVGLYGVIAYSVAQRTREIGIRMALGARRTDVLQLVMRQSLLSALLGVVIGCFGGHLLTRILENQLFGVTRSDVTTYVAVVLMLAIVALLATYIPARRATKVDPMVALRYE
jgi:predicted permease